MEGKLKLKPNLYENYDLNSHFGDWLKNDVLKQQFALEFITNKPYPHIVIENFLNGEFAEVLFSKFPPINEKWHQYDNPIEVKSVLDNLDEMPTEYQTIFNLLCVPEFINNLEKITGINGLECDPYLHGAGLHSHTKNGRLNIHLDYEKHPFIQKERRLNIILFLTKDWKSEWNGALELWKPNMSECEKKVYPKFNTAVIFRTDGNSFHGLPEKLNCMEGVYRNSLAMYYISELCTKKAESMYRYKAKFVKRPSDPCDERMKKLYDIRANRRITKEDMQQIWPEWNSVDN